MNEKVKELLKLKHKLKRLEELESVAVMEDVIRLQAEIPIKEAELKGYKQGQQDAYNKMYHIINNCQNLDIEIKAILLNDLSIEEAKQ